MKKEEQDLFFELCKFKNADKSKLEKLVGDGLDTPAVLGYLFYNRMAAVAYGVLLDHGLLKQTNREFRNSLKMAYLQNKMKNDSYFKCLQMLSKIFADCKGRFAMLKGAYLCKWYPKGYRTSNDIDILVESKDVTQIGEKLSSAGFMQGHIKDDAFIPATRQEIITSKMMRGETVPYIARVDLLGMKYLEVDLNFSMDYKNNDDDIVPDLIKNAGEVRVGNLQVTTLEKSDFILHLCQHLYKEATTYPWVKMRRDMTLYKFLDLYALLFNSTKDDFEQLEKRIIQLQMEPVCYYALYFTKKLFAMETENLDVFLKRIVPKDKSILHQVISPADQKVYQYATGDIRKRFFADDRTILFREVQENAGIKNA